jgi:signal transduction histidine kinase
VVFRYMLAVLAVTAVIRLGAWIVYQVYEVAQGHLVLHEQINETLILLLVEVIALAILGFMLWALSRRLLSPIRSVANAGRLISSGNLDKRIRLSHLPDGELRDIAEALNASFDRYQDAIERVARFSSAAAHQLRTPLTAIRTTAELALEQGVDGANCRQAVESILEEIKHLDRMTEQLLMLSRMEVEHLRGDFVETDLTAVARRVSELFQPLVESGSIDLQLELAEDCTVRGDGALLTEAVMNLVDNAVKWAGEHGAIVLSTGRTQDTVTLRVSDSGPGIDPAFRDRLFDRFSRDPATPYQGSGLGLSVVSEVARLHGGRIEVAAGRQGGAEFTLTLPRTCS